MSLSEIQKERNEQCRERHELAVNRIRSMVTEETVEKAYVGYFQDVALFLLELENTRRKVASGEWGNYTLEGEIYRQALPSADVVWLTKIDADFEGDTTFPELPESEWTTEVLEMLEPTESRSFEVTFCRCERRA